MESVNGTPLRPGDPGGPGGGRVTPSNWKNGEYLGARIPSFMDMDGTAGPLQYLKMTAKNGPIPQDPFLLRLSVEKYIGAPIEGAFKENRGISYVLKVRSSSQFNRLLRMQKLNDGTEISITEHPQLNQRKCVVSNADSTDLDDGYLKEQLANQGVKDIRRIRRRQADGSFTNTPTIILTISGTVVPEHIDFGWSRCRTRNYYPTPMQCYHCWRFGHTNSANKCPEPFRICGKCCKVHPEDKVSKTPGSSESVTNAADYRTARESATVGPIQKRSECVDPLFCWNCNTSDHAASSKKCPIYVKELAIQHIRVDNNLSYPQARREYEARNATDKHTDTFAGTVNQSKDVEVEGLKATVKQLLEDSKRKDARIAEMELALQSRSIVNPRLDTVREHGTIEELVRQVAALTATVEKLQKDLENRDAIIKQLRTENQNDAIATPLVMSIAESEKENAFSLSSNEDIRDIKESVSQKVCQWIEEMDNGNNKQQKGAIPKEKKRKSKKANKPQTTENDKSDASLRSTLSHDSRNTEQSIPPKRTHNTESSGNSTDTSIKAKRNSKIHKADGDVIVD